MIAQAGNMAPIPTLKANSKNGGSNEALAECLNLEVVDYFDKKTHIGRVCKTDYRSRGRLC